MSYKIEVDLKLLDANLKMLLTLMCVFCILVIVARGDRQLGRVAQLGEHLPYMQGVIGSSPIVPTKNFLLVYVVKWRVLKFIASDIWPGSSVG